MTALIAFVVYGLFVGLVWAFLHGAAIASAEPSSSPADATPDQLYDQELDTDDFRAWCTEVER